MKDRATIFFRFVFLFLGICLVFTSCNNSHLATENEVLRYKIADLEYRIYEMSESPEFAMNSLLHDVDLLMQNPSLSNINLSLSLISDFEALYPNHYKGSVLEYNRAEIQQLLNSISTQDKANNSTAFSASWAKELVKLQIYAEVVQGGLGFVNVRLKVVNMGNRDVKNLWIKASAVADDGAIFGISQDFFFNSIAAFNEKSETLSWEYLKSNEVMGLSLSQLRISENRAMRSLKREECFIGDGNVKIFLVF